MDDSDPTQTTPPLSGNFKLKLAEADKHTKYDSGQLCQLLNPPLRCGYRPGPGA